jgi:hypothetical protein
MYSNPRVTAADRRRALPALLAAVTAVLAVAGCEPVQVTTTVQPQPSATAPVATAPTAPPPATAAATPVPAPAATASQLGYLWLPLSEVPDGMVVQASQSHADATSFVLLLANPAGVGLQVSGGTAAQRPSSPPVQAVTVRGQQGSAYTTGGGFTVYWVEGGRPFEIIANGRTLPATLDLAFRFQAMDLQTWRQRVGAA